MTTTIDLVKFKVLLLARQQTLITVKTEGEVAAQTVELDQARMGRLSRMDALQAQAMLQESDRRRNQELRDIAAALLRIAEHDYGYCLDCGDVILEQRLEYNPAVSLCIICATKTESL
jgi:DnaK suppressor protein